MTRRAFTSPRRGDRSACDLSIIQQNNSADTLVNVTPEPQTAQDRRPWGIGDFKPAVMTTDEPERTDGGGDNGNSDEGEKRDNGDRA